MYDGQSMDAPPSARVPAQAVPAQAQARFAEPPESLLRLGNAVRELNEAMLLVEAQDDAVACALREAERHVRTATARIRELAPTVAPGSVPPPDERPRYGFGPVVGTHNPVFPNPRLQHVGGRTSGEVRFGVPFEGPPGFVHGGFVALLFDQILGQHNMAIDASGMTARLTIQYRRPTPLGQRLRFEVEGGRIDARKTSTRASLHDDAGAVAEAEGLFIVPRNGMPTRGM